VLVFPSRVLETYGLTLLEALAVGTNVLACDRGVAGEVVRESGTGFLYRPNDTASLANQLQLICAQYATGELNRFNVRSYLQNRHEHSYLQRLLGVYQPPLAACA
jgi:glycosyltransferase involved in cell wall biosynthesis